MLLSHHFFAMIIQDEECCSHETSSKTLWDRSRMGYREREAGTSPEDSSTSRRSRTSVCIAKLLLTSVTYIILLYSY